MQLCAVATITHMIIIQRLPASPAAGWRGPRGHDSQAGLAYTGGWLLIMPLARVQAMPCMRPPLIDNVPIGSRHFSPSFPKQLAELDGTLR